MSILDPIDLPEFPGAGDVAGELGAKWNSGVARIVSDVDRMVPALQAAERGGVEIQRSGSAVRANTDQTVRGVSDARPNFEDTTATRARINSPGVDARIRNAEMNSFDPRSPTPPPGFSGPESRVRPDAHGIARGGQRVSSRAGEADDLERRI